MGFWLRTGFLQDALAPPAGSERPVQALCAARTRAGTPCALRPVRGRRRCRMHGGASTGPRTADGRRRVGELARARYIAAALAEGWTFAPPLLRAAVGELKRRLGGAHNAAATTIGVTPHAVRRVLTGLPLRPEEYRLQLQLPVPARRPPVLAVPPYWEGLGAASQSQRRQDAGGTAVHVPSGPQPTAMRMHGGASTGPRTAEGRRRLADLARARYILAALGEGWCIAPPGLKATVVAVKRALGGSHNAAAIALWVAGHALRRVLEGLPLRPEELRQIDTAAP